MFGEYGPKTDCSICMITRQVKRDDRCVTQYLMVRNNRGMNAGLYNFPGGKFDKSETFDEGNVREVWEETGIEVKDAKPCGRFDIFLDYPEENSWFHPKQIRVYIFESDKFSGKLRNPLLQEGQTQPEVKAFWCDEDKIPFNHMRDNDVEWFKIYKETGYVNNPTFIRIDNKLVKTIPGEPLEKAKETNEIQEFNQILIAKRRDLAEREGLC